MKYLSWNEEVLFELNPEKISEMYNRGFVLTRIGRGVMQQTRSARICLSQFSQSSENRRIIRKMEGVSLRIESLPLKNYDFSLGKLAKDFYENKFGPGIMSAQKIKEMLTDAEKSNFNSLLIYSMNGKDIGYCIAYLNEDILHYSYPFYEIEKAPADMGLGMMTLAIQHAQDRNKKYIYLGSLQRPGDVYKLQFSGLEWFDGTRWQTDIEAVKDIIRNE